MRILTLKIDLDKLEAARRHPDAGTAFNVPNMLSAIAVGLENRRTQNPDDCGAAELSFFGIPVGTAILEE